MGTRPPLYSWLVWDAQFWGARLLLHATAPASCRLREDMEAWTVGLLMEMQLLFPQDPH